MSTCESPMDIDILLVPYDSAHRSERMGAGPEALIAGGLPAQLERRGHRVRCTLIEPAVSSWRAEIRTAFELAAALVAAVQAARSARRFPLVLAGNCSAALGVATALGAGTPVLWMDAHADFNTPETTAGGFLDGMALATLTGRCWAKLAGQIPGFMPVPDDRVWLLGARDLDPLEAEALGRSAIRRVPPEALGAGQAARIVRELAGMAPPYLHLDLDVLDPGDGRANAYAAAGGASAADLAAFCALLGRCMPPAALTLSAYDPAADVDGRARQAAFLIVNSLLSGVEIPHGA